MSADIESIRKEAMSARAEGRMAACNGFDSGQLMLVSSSVDLGSLHLLQIWGGDAGVNGSH